MIQYLSNQYPDIGFYVCFNKTRELTKEERKIIFKEAHAYHLGKANTIHIARELGDWKGTNEDIKKYVKACIICQLQKTVENTNQKEAIIADIPTRPNGRLERHTD